MVYILLAIAIAPGVAIALIIYRLDKYEREPFQLLLKSFIYGILSVGVTLILSFIVNQFIPIVEDRIIEEGIHAFFTVAFVEELSKYLFLIFFLYPHKEFNEPFDGIVYAVMIGMGFATLENIVYSIQHGFSVAMLRMFTAVPGHATYAVLMGYFAGRAKFTIKNKYYSVIGLFVAILFHGFYDFFIFISHIPGVIIGTLISLIVGVWLSLKAIRASSDASPFRTKRKLT